MPQRTDTPETKAGVSPLEAKHRPPVQRASPARARLNPAQVGPKAQTTSPPDPVRTQPREYCVKSRLLFHSSKIGISRNQLARSQGHASAANGPELHPQTRVKRPPVNAGARAVTPLDTNRPAQRTDRPRNISRSTITDAN